MAQTILRIPKEHNLSESTMKVFHAPITPSSRRVRIFLMEKGIDVPMVDVDDNFKLAGWYKERYPHAVVPMLELDDGTQIGEAVAICRYFEALHPRPNLMGDDAREKAIIEMWERRAYLEGSGAIEEIFRNAHPLMANRGLQGTDDPVPQIPALIERGRDRLRRFCEKFDLQLSQYTYVAGKRFSIADISAYCAVDFGRAVDIGIPPQYKNLHRWYADISARPSVRSLSQ